MASVPRSWTAGMRMAALLLVALALALGAACQGGQEDAGENDRPSRRSPADTPTLAVPPAEAAVSPPAVLPTGTATPPAAVLPAATPTPVPAATTPRQRLGVSPARSVSTSVQSGQRAVLSNQAGAAIVIPASSASEAFTVSITEVDPPESHVDVGKAFDFSVVDGNGREVDLGRPVTLTLPYELPEGKDHPDVLVLHWNENLQEWEAVEGGTVDAVSQTIIVSVTDLSIYATSWALTLAELIEQSLESLVDASLGEDYEAGNKHLVAFKASGGVHKFNGSITLILDVDDLLGITEEGKAGYVTAWLNLTAGLGSVSSSGPLSYGIHLFVHDRTGVADDDPRYKATFKSLTVSGNLGPHAVELNLLQAQMGKISPVSGEYSACLACAQPVAGRISWADLTWNAAKAEIKVRPDAGVAADDIHEILFGRLGPVDGAIALVSPEAVASQVIGALFDILGRQVEAVARETAAFTSYDSPSPDVVAGWDDSQHSQIISHCGGLNLYGNDEYSCISRDMVFSSHVDARGSPVADIPLELRVKGDLRETKDFFVRLTDLTPGWKIEVDRDSSAWTQFVTWALHGNRAQFEAQAGSPYDIPYLVGNEPGAPNPGVATFELVHVIGAGSDLVLDRYRVELWNDREVSDLSVEALGKPHGGSEGERLTYAVTVENAGPDRADEVILRAYGPDLQGLVLADAATPFASQRCAEAPYFGTLSCQLGALDANQSVAVTLEFDPQASLQAGQEVEADFQVATLLYDPPENNFASAKIVVNRPASSPGQTRASFTPFASVSAGLSYTCGMRLDGSVACWGSNQFGQASPPAGEFASVSAGYWHTCGMKQDGSVACWGRNKGAYGTVIGQASPPAGEFTSVSAGTVHTCGVKRNGSVVCWGWNEYGQATPLAGEFAFVSARGHHTCGLTRDGSVVCWGWNEYGQATPPAGGFASVSAGVHHTCGLTRDGSVACWGRNNYGQATPPPGEFASVSAGWFHSCGLTQGGSVACWGSNEEGQATPPSGEFASVSAGHYHTCGVKQDGSVACWGDDKYGQATPTAGEFASISEHGFALLPPKPDTPETSLNPVVSDVTTDRDALVTFYSATDGKGSWKYIHNWLSDRPIGEWFGVTTDADGRVTKLDLKNNWMNGEIPRELGNLSKLEYLDLTSSNLRGAIPPDLGNLTNLKTLLLDNNPYMHSTMPRELGNLSSLEVLNLSHLNLSGEIPPELGNLENLRFLYLDYNQLSGCVPSSLLDRLNYSDLGSLQFCP